MENKLDLEIQSHLGKLMNQGKMVEAIAFIQNNLRIGLKNSKDLVEAFAKFQHSNPDASERFKMPKFNL